MRITIHKYDYIAKEGFDVTRKYVYWRVYEKLLYQEQPRLSRLSFCSR